jgi:hypothetical protein
VEGSSHSCGHMAMHVCDLCDQLATHWLACCNGCGLFSQHPSYLKQVSCMHGLNMYAMGWEA